MPRLSTRVSNPFAVFDDGFGHNTAGAMLQFGPRHESSPLAPGQDPQFGPFTAIAGFGPTATRPHNYGHYSGQPVCAKPFGPNQELGGTFTSLRPQATNFSNGSTSNCVEFVNSLGHRREIGPSGDSDYHASGPSVPWRTKPRACVYTGSDACIGLPHLPNLHESDVSNSTRSNIHAT